MILLTFNDPPSGIFKSQVVDVVELLREEADEPVHLVSFVSPRNFFQDRRWIRKELKGAWVLPFIAPLRDWWRNFAVLKGLTPFLDTRRIVARGVFACNMALALKEKGKAEWVCYDGRGAVTAEHEEYGVFEGVFEPPELEKLERRAVRDSDHRIAVSEKLVEHWRERFGYDGAEHTMIPSTLQAKIQKPDRKDIESARQALRNEMDWGTDDRVLVYAGSLAAWQSLEGLLNWLRGVFEQAPDACVLFLSPEKESLQGLMKEYPGRVGHRYATPESVHRYLLGSDVGLLLREDSVTNRVASPVKFAEYLAAGLKVVISEQLGDCSSFVKAHDCGVIRAFEGPYTLPEDMRMEEKERIIELAFQTFSKSGQRVRDQYRKLLAVGAV